MPSVFNLPPVYVLWDYRRCSVKKCIVDTPCKRVYFFSPLHCCVAMPWPALIHAVYSYRPAITVHIRYIQFAFMLYRYYYNYNTLYSKKINFLQPQKNIDDTALYFKFFKKYCKNLLTAGAPTVILALQSKTGTCKGALSPALSLFFSPAWAWLHVVKTWAAARKTPGAALQAALYIDIA